MLEFAPGLEREWKSRLASSAFGVNPTDVRQQFSRWWEMYPSWQAQISLICCSHTGNESLLNWVVLVAVVIMLFTSSGQAILADDNSQFLEIERACVQNRRNIKSGRVALTVRHTKNSSQPIFEQIVREYSLIFTQRRYRMDCRWSGPSGTDRYYKIVTPELVLDSGSPGSPIVVSDREDRTLENLGVPDPRVLGMAPSGFDALCQYGLEDLLLAPNRTLVSLKKVQLNDEEVWQCEFTFDTEIPLDCTTWIAPTKGHSLVAYKCVEKWGVHTKITEMNITPHHVTDENVWFPSKLVYRSLVDGELHREEVIQVQSATFADGVAYEEFSPTALGLPDGTEYWVDAKQMTLMNGRLVHIPPSGMEVPQERYASTNAVLFGISLLLAVGAAVTHVRFRAANRS